MFKNQFGRQRLFIRWGFWEPYEDGEYTVRDKDGKVLATAKMKQRFRRCLCCGMNSEIQSDPNQGWAFTGDAERYFRLANDRPGMVRR